ncbi:MAG: AI-2E family transporter [Candidatus Eremiobacteraeota bacterium]|nr:AI-2E family transporter [Candidatus Eremiobacteraeota bacterium]
MGETSNKKETRLKIHWTRFAVWVIVLIIAAALLIKIYHTLIIFAIALLIAYLLSPAVSFFSRLTIPVLNKKLSWFASIIIVYILLLAILVTSGVVLVPVAIEQVNNIVRDTPVLVGKIQEYLLKMEIKYENLNIPADVEVRIEKFINSTIEELGNAIGVVFKSVGSVLLGIISWVFFFVIALIIAMFILTNIKNMKKQFYSYIPLKYLDEIKDLLMDINNIFGNYIRGYSVLCMINGFLTYMMLFVVVWIFRLFPHFSHDFPFFKYALIISIIAGATYFIPYLGCGSTVVIAMALAFLQKPTPGYVAMIGLVALLTNQFVDRFITPKMLGDVLGVSTLFIVFAAFAGGELLGIWGLIIGIPMAVMLLSIFRFLQKRFLEHPVSEEIPAKESGYLLPEIFKKTKASEDFPYIIQTIKFPGGNEEQEKVVENQV